LLIVRQSSTHQRVFLAVNGYRKAFILASCANTLVARIRCQEPLASLIFADNSHFCPELKIIRIAK
jgi:hypothetical protein